MQALTIWQPWASLIVAGCKPYEFRRWRFPDRFVGQRIVLHAGAHRIPRDDLAELLDDLTAGRATTIYPVGRAQRARAIKIVERMWRDTMRNRVNADDALPFSAGVGTAFLDEPVRCIDLFRAHGGIDHRAIDPDIWAWPMRDIEAWDTPVPAKGWQGFWTWPDEAGDAP